MKRLIAFLLFASATFAQTPTQVKGAFLQNHTRYDFTLDQPTIQGQAIIMFVYAAGALWEPGPVCVAAAQAAGFPMCNYNLYDSQGNQFIQVNRDYSGFYYIPASKGGIETITVAYATPQNQNLSIIVTVWPDTLVLQDVAKPQCGFYPVGNENQICNPFYSDGSWTFNDNTAVLSSHTLTSSVPNELFIGFGSIGHFGPVFTPAAGWADPVWGGELFISHATAGPVGTQETFTLYANPPLGPEQYGTMGIQGFKAIPIQP